jgi:hypothetical protein
LTARKRKGDAMMDLRLVKGGQPPLVIETARDEYSMRFVIRHRRSTRKMQPEQRGAVLLAAAAQMEIWAGQMRDEAMELGVG